MMKNQGFEIKKTFTARGVTMSFDIGMVRISRREAAHILGISRQYVSDLVKNGDITEFNWGTQQSFYYLLGEVLALKFKRQLSSEVLPDTEIEITEEE